MKPVDQTEFGHKRGNCFSACVASLLEVPVAEVPWFMGGVRPWQEQLDEWLAPRGYYSVVFVIQDRGAYDRDKLWPKGFYILSGKSPRGVGEHSVVARGADIAHDPHPSRDGIGDITDLCLIVPTFDARRPSPADQRTADARRCEVTGCELPVFRGAICEPHLFERDRADRASRPVAPEDLSPVTKGGEVPGEGPK